MPTVTVSFLPGDLVVYNRHGALNLYYANRDDVSLGRVEEVILNKGRTRYRVQIIPLEGECDGPVTTQSEPTLSLEFNFLLQHPAAKSNPKIIEMIKDEKKKNEEKDRKKRLASMPEGVARYSH